MRVKKVYTEQDGMPRDSQQLMIPALKKSGADENIRPGPEKTSAGTFFRL
jgi:hypothetical protein